MRIGDTPPFSGLSEIKGSQWDNGDRALLRTLFGAFNDCLCSMYSTDPNVVKSGLDDFKSTLEEFRNCLMNKLPPEVDSQIDEALSNLDEIFKDILSPDPQKQGEALDKLSKELDSVHTIVKSWM